MFEDKDIEKMPGHWVLARMGKRVLRPGGKELTQKLIGKMGISVSDHVVEFAPGLGFTASLALRHHPLSYTGVDADAEAVKLLQTKFKGKNISFIQGNAAQTNLPDNSKDRVYGEAMLTMHANHRKAEIIREAARILKPGGLYGIHELGLMPDDMDEPAKAQVQKNLALAIKVNARPLTAVEWAQLLEQNGFRVRSVMKAPMHLLKLRRMIDDEGFAGTVKITYNIMMNTKARKRILSMRRVFHNHGRQMNAVAIIAEKI